MRLGYTKTRVVGILSIIIIGIGLTLMLVSKLNNDKNIQVENDFYYEAEKLLSSVEKSVETQMLTMLAMQNFLNTETTRADFNEFTTPFLENVIGIQALEWIPRITSGTKQKYIDLAKIWRNDYLIKEKNENGEFVEVIDKDEYFPVYFVEPLKGNEAAVGFDLSSNETRNKSLDKARETGKIVTTSKIELVQETGSQSGFLVFLPVYEGDLVGFALGVFRVGDLVDESVKYYKNIDIDIYVSDITDGVENLHYYSFSEQDHYNENYFEDTNNVLSKEYSLLIGDRTWKLNMIASENYLDKYSSMFISVILFIGFIATLAIASYFDQIIRKSVMIQKLVDERTNELMVSKNDAERSKEQAIVLTNEANEARDEAELANKSKNIFLRNINHELKTPLNGILGLSSTLLKNENSFNEKQLMSLKYINDCGHQLLELINGLLDYEKASDGYLIKTESECDIDALVDDFIQIFNGLVEDNNGELSKKLSLDISVLKGTPKCILTDSKKLHQILYNIIGNAVKFTPEGSVKISILNKQEMINFVVEDTGIGIEESQQERIFNIFEQVDNSETRNFDGAGIGLALSKRLIDVLDGNILIDSIVDQGTVVTIKFPLKVTNSDYYEENFSYYNP